MLEPARAGPSRRSRNPCGALASGEVFPSTDDPLSAFSPRVRDWFAASFAAPTPAQAQAWPAIASGEHVLLSAPTGSGKTLAAFLWALDRLSAQPRAREGGGERSERTRQTSRARGGRCARGVCVAVEGAVV